MAYFKLNYLASGVVGGSIYIRFGLQVVGPPYTGSSSCSVSTGALGLPSVKGYRYNQTTQLRGPVGGASEAKIELGTGPAHTLHWDTPTGDYEETPATKQTLANDDEVVNIEVDLTRGATVPEEMELELEVELVEGGGPAISSGPAMLL
jgi:hypothetical protein